MIGGAWGIIESFCHIKKSISYIAEDIWGIVGDVWCVAECTWDIIGDGWGTTRNIFYIK